MAKTLIESQLQVDKDRNALENLTLTVEDWGIKQKKFDMNNRAESEKIETFSNKLTLKITSAQDGFNFGRNPSDSMID
jgi:hypothetical protein